MLVTVYVVIAVLGFAGMIVTFSRHEEGDIQENIFLPFVVATLFLVLGLTSASIEKISCESTVNKTVAYNYSDNTTTEYISDWSCFQTAKENRGLIWLFWGIGLFMLVYAVFVTLSRVLREGVRDMEKAARESEI